MSIPGTIFFPDRRDFTLNPVGSEKTLTIKRSFAELVADSTMAANPATKTRRIRSNENKMTDGGRDRDSIGVYVWKSYQKSERTAVRRSLHRMVRRFAWH